MFSIERTIRMEDTDAAGIIYFANQLKIAHESLEDLLTSEGLDFASIFTDKIPYYTVIVHAESNYRTALAVGDKLVVSPRISHIGTTSFSVNYTLTRNGTIVGDAQTVHVCLDKRTRAKTTIPDALLTILNRHRD